MHAALFDRAKMRARCGNCQFELGEVVCLPNIVYSELNHLPGDGTQPTADEIRLRLSADETQPVANEIRLRPRGVGTEQRVLYFSPGFLWTAERSCWTLTTHALDRVRRGKRPAFTRPVPSRIDGQPRQQRKRAGLPTEAECPRCHRRNSFAPTFLS
jgi:hypothetical protein